MQGQLWGHEEQARGAARERLCWDGNAETPGGPPAKDLGVLCFLSH